MERDDKELFKNIGYLFLSVLITMRLPQDSYSINEYIIRPIRFYDSMIYIAGIVPLALGIFGIRGILRSERFKNSNAVLVVLVIVLLVVPMIRGALETSKSTVIKMIDHELRSLHLYSGDISILHNSYEEKTSLRVYLNLVDYGRSPSNFQVRVYLPESWSTFTDVQYLELPGTYSTYGNRTGVKIEEAVIMPMKELPDKIDLWDSKWYWETFRFELYNENGQTNVMYRGKRGITKYNETTKIN